MSISVQSINEQNVSISISSDDGKLGVVSNGNATSRLDITVDRSAVGALNAVQVSPMVISFEAEVPVSIAGTRKMVPVGVPLQDVAQVETIYTTRLEIPKVPAFPIDLTKELFDINVQDTDGVLMVATVTMEGTMVGDVVMDASSFDPTTGRCVLEFIRPLKPDQNVLHIKRFPVTKSPDYRVAIPGLIPYLSRKQYSFVLPMTDSILNPLAPIAPGSLTITAVAKHGGSVKVIDDKNGNLVGEVNGQATNRVQYATREVEVTFNQNLKENSIIRVEYAVLHEVQEYKNPDSGATRICVSMPWEDIARVVKSVEQAANSAESNIKYRLAL